MRRLMRAVQICFWTKLRRLMRALQIYFGTQLCWTIAWNQAAAVPSFRPVVRDDGFEYIEPRAR